jgi:hypothetical protein
MGEASTLLCIGYGAYQVGRSIYMYKVMLKGRVQRIGISDISAGYFARCGYRCPDSSHSRRYGDDGAVNSLIKKTSYHRCYTRSINGSLREYKGVLVEITEIPRESAGV